MRYPEGVNEPSKPVSRARRPHPEDPDLDLYDRHYPPPSPLPQRPPYGYQFMTGSWREFVDDVYDREQNRRTPQELVEAGVRFVRSLWERGGRLVRREPSLVDRRESARGKVQALGDQHHPDTSLDLPGHPVPTLGCPWCIDGERAQRADDMLGALNPDEWYLLSAHTARYVLAIGDLVRERSL